MKRLWPSIGWDEACERCSDDPSCSPRIGQNADINAVVRLGPQDEPKSANLVQALLHQPVAGDSEVRRGDVQRLFNGVVSSSLSASTMRCCWLSMTKGIGMSCPTTFSGTRAENQLPVVGSQFIE